MTIWERLKNLWRLSETDLTEVEKKVEAYKPKMASIIKLEPDLTKILNQNE